MNAPLRLGASLAITLGLFLSLPNSLTALAIAAEPPKMPAAEPPKMPAGEQSYPTARVVPFHGYAKAIELTRGNARAVLSPQVGGRVLEFSVDGRDAMFLDPAEKTWQPGQPAQSSAGRFDT